MKIQGVEVLRITDFRRFFDMEDFLVNSKLYADMFQEIDMELFCNNKLEGQLITQLRAWCNGIQLNTTFKDGQISLPGNNTWLPAENPIHVLNEFREAISYKDRLGLAYLFILLKDAWTTDMIKKGCETFIEFKTGVPTGEFISIHKDTILPLGKSQIANLTRRFIANTKHTDDITVSLGEIEVVLHQGDCVIGLFNEQNECVKLLPNVSYSEDKKIRLKLKADLYSEKTYVEIIRPEWPEKEKVYEVCSFWIEPGNHVVVLKNDGDLVIIDDNKEQTDISKCFKLKKQHQIFKQSHPEKKIIAIEPTQCNYLFYSI